MHHGSPAPLARHLAVAFAQTPPPLGRASTTRSRISAWKAATEELPTEADQRRRMARLMMTPEQERDLDQWLGVFNEAISGTKATAPAAKSNGPVRIARFECG
jgi:hypothetical protein